MTQATNRWLKEKFGARRIYWNWDNFNVTFELGKPIKMSDLREIEERIKPKSGMVVFPKSVKNQFPVFGVALLNVDFVTA